MAERDPMTRRGFVRNVAAGAAGALALTGAASAAPDDTKKSRVVIVRHSGATDKDDVKAGPVEQMIDRAMLELTGAANVRAAWEHYFKPHERIGIKVNARGGPTIAVAPCVLKVCVDRLTAIGIPAQNIIFYDMYADDLKNSGMSKEGFHGAQVMTSDVGWSPELEQGVWKGSLTTIVTEKVDAIINLPILKDHVLAGVTLALKNHYGTINNPSKYHADNCDPAVADINATPAIRDKHRLVICDGTRSLPDGGPHLKPGFLLYTNMILAASDPVAHDTIGWQIIEEQRKTEFKLPPLARVGRPTKHLRSAAERGLGTDQLDRIEKIDITLA